MAGWRASGDTLWQGGQPGPGQPIRGQDPGPVTNQRPGQWGLLSLSVWWSWNRISGSGHYCHPVTRVSQSANQKWPRRGSANCRIINQAAEMAMARVWRLRLMLSLTFEILALPLEFQTSPVWQIYPGPRDAYLEELCVLVLRILQIDNIHLAAGPGCSG